MTEKELLREIVEFFNEDGSYWITCKCLGKRLDMTEDEVDNLITKLIKE